MTWIDKPFHPAWWLPGPHLQTLWPVLTRKHYTTSLRSERLQTPDDDFLDLAWTDGDEGPLVIILHGLEGSIDSHYAWSTVGAIKSYGWRAVLMHFRGCSGEPNRAVRGYHSGETTDLDFLVRTLRESEPDTPIAIVGYSLGGNVLLKWLGERGDTATVQAAVAISVPYELDKCAKRLEYGISRLYQRHLVRSMRDNAFKKFAHRNDAPFDLAGVDALKTFREFDDFVTAPLHGFANVDDYYSHSSSPSRPSSIRSSWVKAVPLLLSTSRNNAMPSRYTSMYSLPSLSFLISKYSLSLFIIVIEAGIRL